ncbi:MAG TPA: glycogen synthase GlgA [Stellaceae bacterium]
MPRSRRKLRVLHVAAEIYPWVKTGGLGDVIAALPAALAAAGADLRLCLPGLPALLDAARENEVVRLATPFAVERVRIGLARLPGQPPAYIVDHPAFFDRPGGPYGGPDGEFPDNHRRFALLGWVAAALAEGADPGWRPQILHGHDWHAGLAPAYLKARGSAVPSVFTVHNLAYHGLFPAARFADLALPPEFFAIDGVEFYGDLSLMKSGLFYADQLTTVSPTYAAEILTPRYGANFDGLLQARAGVLRGILNGVDPTVWNPAADAALPRGYGVDDAEAGKAVAKAELQRRMGLAEDATAPLFATVTRLTPQKGMDLLLAALPGLIELGGQFALLGNGDRDLEEGFAAAALAEPGRVAAALRYDEGLARLIYAGADVIAVPSRFEPCGLAQLYALRYGALPLVRRTGGLADTVVDADDDTATGFAFDDETAEALLGAAARAFAVYRDPARWRGMVWQAMTRDFSWAAAAREYLTLYRELAPT